MAGTWVESMAVPRVSTADRTCAFSLPVGFRAPAAKSANGRAPAATKVGYPPAQLGCQLSGCEFARLAVAGQPVKAARLAALQQPIKAEDA